MKPSEESTGSSTPRSVQLSSFRPSKNNCRRHANGITELRLKESEVSAHMQAWLCAYLTEQRFLVLGSFGIRVLEGEVAVAGTTLRADGETHWVHASYCHAIPVLRTRPQTRLELHMDPCAPALRQLGRLSPLFRNLWNEPASLSFDIVSGPASLGSQG